MLPICHEEQQRRTNYDYVGSFKYNSWFLKSHFEHFENSLDNLKLWKSN